MIQPTLNTKKCIMEPTKIAIKCIVQPALSKIIKGS